MSAKKLKFWETYLESSCKVADNITIPHLPPPWWPSITPVTPHHGPRNAFFQLQYLLFHHLHAGTKSNGTVIPLMAPWSTDTVIQCITIGMSPVCSSIVGWTKLCLQRIQQKMSLYWTWSYKKMFENNFPSAMTVWALTRRSFTAAPAAACNWRVCTAAMNSLSCTNSWSRGSRGSTPCN